MRTTTALAVPAFAALALLACDDPAKADQDSSTPLATTGPGSGTPTGTTGGAIDATFAVDWTDDGSVPTDTDGDGLPDTGCNDSVLLTITDPLGVVEWELGMAETGSPAGWFGEDCLYGYASYTHCHYISGTTLSLDEVTTCSAMDVMSGLTTLLDASLDPAITYYVHDVSNDVCWAFGHDPTYYASLGCDVI